jgi:hypothetical protein
MIAIVLAFSFKTLQSQGQPSRFKLRETFFPETRCPKA